MFTNDGDMDEPNKVTKWILAGIAIGVSLIMVLQILTTCI